MQQETMVNDMVAAFVKECGFKRYPKEACGFVLADAKGKPFCIECENKSLEPNSHFLIDPEDFLKAEKQGKIVACWHTHCDMSARASEADKVGCQNTQVPWFIGAVYGKEEPYRFEGLELVECNNGYEAPLIGRPYSFGVFDCFSLMRDYYKRELHIELPELPRTERIWASEPDYMAKTAVEKFGFVRMPEGEPPHRGDLFFIQTGRDGADHIGIYIGDDRILHQMRNRLSRTDIYGGSYWQEHTLTHWRHKTYVDESNS